MVYVSGMKIRPRPHLINNSFIFQQGQAIDRSRQAGVSKPEVGQLYQAVCRLRVRQRSVIQRGAKVQVAGRLRRRGQACGLGVRTGKGQNQEGERRETGKSRR
jgi:hypothetical protein